MIDHRDHGPASRAAAARAVAMVLAEGRSLGQAIESALLASPGAQPALCSELAYGTLRYWPRLARIAELLLSKPLPANGQDVHALLLVGLYQLEELGTPAHVAVTNSVEAARLMGRDWACGLVNAVLRGSQRQQQRLRTEVASSPAARHAHPQWLIDAIRASNPDCWAEILEANNQRPPMTLRINARQTSREDYLHRLAEAGIEATATRHSQQGLRLERPVGVETLPGFSDGLVSVQDEAAQLAAPLIDAAAGQRVLDACAAPGGKCAHLLEAGQDIAELVALDSEPVRVARLQETLRRLRLDARVITGDALKVEQWWDGRQFDRILIDAPCSATGVIRRHPDIKALRTAHDIVALSATQRALLQSLWPLVSRGGKLLYVTCSVLQEENAGVVEAFLGGQADARSIGIDANWGRNAGPGRQILPGENGMDGFFYALLGKD